MISYQTLRSLHQYYHIEFIRDVGSLHQYHHCDIITDVRFLHQYHHIDIIKDVGSLHQYHHCDITTDVRSLHRYHHYDIIREVRHLFISITTLISLQEVEDSERQTMHTHGDSSYNIIYNGFQNISWHTTILL